ncbi:MAG: hypothetical protein COA79_22470 [Planctomycetota bacterium]|nr:MAG: hypothetical protein COA79_22470 [Planctomycetota bacterium]
MTSNFKIDYDSINSREDYETLIKAVAKHYHDEDSDTMFNSMHDMINAGPFDDEQYEKQARLKQYVSISTKLVLERDFKEGIYIQGQSDLQHDRTFVSIAIVLDAIYFKDNGECR